MKICQDNPSLVKKQTKISGTLHKHLSVFYCCRRHKFAIKALLSNNKYVYVVDSVT